MDDKSELEVRRGLENIYGQVWDTDELQRDFKVESFAYGFCFLTRKSDGAKGSINFIHAPRFYFDFRPSGQ